MNLKFLRKTFRGFFSSLLLILALAGSSVAQEQPEHKPTRYVSPEGKLYWNRKLPVYLFVSPEEDGDNGKMMKSKTSAGYVNPLYLDTEGVNYISTRWAVDENGRTVEPKIEVKFEVYGDGIPPATKMEIGKAPAFVSAAGKRFYGPDMTISFNASDGMSGVKVIYYSLDEEDYLAYQSPIVVSAEKDYNIKYFAVDQVNNVEEVKVFAFAIDTTPPLTSHKLDADFTGSILSARSKITLKASDNRVGIGKINYQIDDGPLLAYGGDISTATLGDGPHKLSYFATDLLRNREKLQVYEFSVDKTAPLVEPRIKGDQYQNRGRVFISDRSNVELVAADQIAGIRKIMYRVDDGEEREYIEPFPLKKSTGSHTIYYYAIDRVGNSHKGVLDESNATRKGLDIDMIAPAIDHAFDGSKYFTRDTMFIRSNTNVLLSSKDNDSGVKTAGYKVNGGNGEVYEQALSFAEEGFYKVDYYATDFVNNRNQKEFFFVVDNAGPEISTIFSMRANGKHKTADGLDLEKYTSGTTLYLAATDAVVDTKDIFYSLNGGQRLKYVAPLKLTKAGVNELRLAAVDKLDNESAERTIRFFIE